MTASGTPSSSGWDPSAFADALLFADAALLDAEPPAAGPRADFAAGFDRGSSFFGADAAGFAWAGEGEGELSSSSEPRARVAADDPDEDATAGPDGPCFCAAIFRFFRLGFAKARLPLARVRTWRPTSAQRCPVRSRRDAPSAPA